VFALDNPERIKSNEMRFDLRIDDHMGQRVAWMSNSLKEDMVLESIDKISFNLSKLSLNAGLYYVTFFLEVRSEVSDWVQNAFSFEVSEGDYYGTGKVAPLNQSNVLLDFNVVYNV
jgi:lipopolysaccharide transport system ATP-binding protein